jgi:hypothetical protein
LGYSARKALEECIMKHALTLVLVLCLSWIAPLGAADQAAFGETAMPDARRVESGPGPCPAPAGFDRVAQASQSDCCKGHKGVCGCRAGKIVCCDNTTSATCPCHADSGVEN